MSKDETMNPQGTLINRIFSFAEDPDDVQTMSIEEVRAYLADEGIDTRHAHRQLRERLAAIQGRRRLEEAKRKREAFSTELSNLLAIPREVVDDVRSEIARRLESLNVSNPSLAQAYFRKFENASQGDLDSLLSDIQLLEDMQKGEE